MGGQGGGAAVEQSALGDNARPIDFNDWRAQLPPDSRHRIVRHIMDTMKKHLRFPGRKLFEGLKEIKETAIGFEESVYSTAKSQSDYLRMISLKMLTMKTKSNSLQSTAGSKSSDLDSTAESRKTGAGDWQEEVYEKIKSMKDMYLLELNELYMKIGSKMQQHETRPQLTNEQFDKLNFFKHMLERFIQFMQLSKNDIQISHKDKLGAVEKLIMSILHANKPCKIAPLAQEQLPQSHMPWMQNSQPQSHISRVHYSQPQSRISHMQTHETGNTGAGDWQEEVYQKNHENQMNPPLMQPMNVQTPASIEQLIQKLEVDV